VTDPPPEGNRKHRVVCVSDYYIRKVRVRSGRLTSSDTWNARGEVADDGKGLFFADEGEVDVVVCEVGGELLYTTRARRQQG
jgi:hypothetical protein